MIRFQLMLLHQTIVYVTEMSPNTFSKMVNQFSQKAHAVLILPASGANNYIYCLKRFQNSNVRVSNGNIKFPFGKLVLEANLLLKLFRATVANDYRSVSQENVFKKSKNPSPFLHKTIGTNNYLF